MRRMAIKLILSLALVPAAAFSQLPDNPDMGPGGRTFHPPGPLDTTHTRQQADQNRDEMVAPLKISFGKKSAEWTAPKLAQLPHETIQTTNERTQAQETYSGVPLMALLVELGVPQKLKGQGLPPIPDRRGPRWIQGRIFARRSFTRRARRLRAAGRQRRRQAPRRQRPHRTHLFRRTASRTLGPQRDFHQSPGCRLIF